MGTSAVLWFVVAVQAVLAQEPCSRVPRPPEVNDERTVGDSGYAISVSGRPEPEAYIPGQVYTVTLNGTYPNKRFSGFYLVAVPENAIDETTTLGTFQHFPNPALTKFSEECPHILTHTYSLLKDGVSVLWTAPPTGSGCVEFRASVVESTDVWYKDDGALTKIFCEDELAGGLPIEQTGEVPECCACGVAKYHMVFMGNWSRYTHPKDFPTFQQLLHWSNIVGASHSKDYTLWKYGGMASRGVKEVCEYGSARVMEREIKQNGRSVRTVIKTPGIWVNLRETRWARFTVNRTHHLMSMLTMLGPSPDWCVGLSGLNLCQDDCSWADDQRIELYPWDAGTDSGVTYMSPNRRTEPQERIHRLSNQFPDNPRSPFYGPEPIKPLATILIKRLHPKLATECVEDTVFAEDPPPLDETEGENEEDYMSPAELNRKRAQEAGKCVVNEWSIWTACSVTCGVGYKSRTRRFVMPGITPQMCPPVDLRQTERCVGSENQCDYSQLCSTTSWSEWSACSATCGKGSQTRSRDLIRVSEMRECAHLKYTKTQECTNEMSCMEFEAQRNYTQICSQPKLVGRCRGSFLKWYWDTTMRSCLPFHYGGCRGNENRFPTRDKCELMCREASPPSERDDAFFESDDNVPNFVEGLDRGGGGGGETPPRGQTVDCLVTEWTAWSPCSVTCGRGYTTKTRIITRSAANGGRPCPKRLLRRRRCHIQKCPVDCELGEWSAWEPCSQTCGDAVQTRIKQITQRPRNGGQQCHGVRIEKRYCSLPDCPGQPRQQNDAPAARYQRYIAQDDSEQTFFAEPRDGG